MPPLRRCAPRDLAYAPPTAEGSSNDTFSWTLQVDSTAMYRAPNDTARAGVVLPFDASNPPTEYLLHHAACSLTASPLQLRACFAGKPALFLGDSLTRYQFFSLVEAVEHGVHTAWDPPTEREKDFGSWRNFYIGTHARLGAGACDCWRSETDMTARWCRADGVCHWYALGTRYYVSPAHGVELTFLETLGPTGLGPNPMTLWHEPRAFGLHCSKSALGEEFFNSSGGGHCAAPHEVLCTPGECTQAPHHLEEMWVAVRSMVQRLLPKVLVLNSGIWGVQWGEEGKVAALMAALDWAVAEGGVETVIWKTTTKTIDDVTGTGVSDGEFTARQEALVVGEFLNRSWPVLDAGGATKALLQRQIAQPEEKDKIWVDKVHYTGSVYRALNDMLHTIVCGEA